MEIDWKEVIIGISWKIMIVGVLIFVAIIPLINEDGYTTEEEIIDYSNITYKNTDMVQYIFNIENICIEKCNKYYPNTIESISKYDDNYKIQKEFSNKILNLKRICECTYYEGASNNLIESKRYIKLSDDYLLNLIERYDNCTDILLIILENVSSIDYYYLMDIEMKRDFCEVKIDIDRIVNSKLNEVIIRIWSEIPYEDYKLFSNELQKYMNGKNKYSQVIMDIGK